MRGARRLAFALVALLASGCGGALRFETRVVHPPRLAVASDETISIVYGPDPIARLVAEGLFDALRARGVVVDVPTARLADVPDSTSRVLLIDTETRVTLRTEWTTRPENVCGAYGCYVRNVSQPYEMPYLVARFDARIVSRTSRLIEHAYTGLAEVAGVEDSVGRRRIAARVLERLVAGMSPQTENVRVSFEAFDEATAEAAVIDARDGRFDDARRRLEARLSDETLDDAARARVHYDIALVLTFDPATPNTSGGFTTALEHAEQSVRLDPTRRHVAILERVRAMVDASRRITIGTPYDAPSTGPTEGLPDVPDAYRGDIPPAPP